MKEAIQKAIEGGWDKKRALFNPNDASYSMEKMYCDPLFWQCLGKALGWENNEPFRYCENCGGRPRKNTPIYFWHRFIDRIAEGKDIDEFFNNLTK